jgi:hypothetical protein
LAGRWVLSCLTLSIKRATTTRNVRVEDHDLTGDRHGSIVMNGATIGARSLVAGVIPEVCTFRPKPGGGRVLAKIRRTLRAEDVQVIRTNAGVCVDLARQQEPAFPGTEARA